MASPEDKWTETRDRLITNALRKPTFGTAPPSIDLQELEADTKKLYYVLREVCIDDPAGYSLVLQSYLAARGIDWPDDVFKHDFTVPSRGRALSPLSINSWYLHVNRAYGWRSVARQLIPEEYSRNPDEAAKKVRKAANRFVHFRKSVLNALVPPSKRLRRILDGIVSLIGLELIAWQVIYRKFRTTPESLADFPVKEGETEFYHHFPDEDVR
jgi:hypothetical protein